MGYYTEYELTWEPKSLKVTEYLEQKQNEDEDFCYGISPEGTATDTCKWYDHETDVRKLSQEFPDLTFTLKGHGEDAGDTWAKRFTDGHVETAKTYFVFSDGKQVQTGRQ